MKKLLTASALCIAMACATSVQAAEPNLAAMGLSGMQKMTQTQAKQVRGQGAIVWGTSNAAYGGFIGGSSASNSYIGFGRRFAVGGSISVAGGNFGGVYAGGGAIAYGR